MGFNSGFKGLKQHSLHNLFEACVHYKVLLPTPIPMFVFTS